VVNLWRDDEEPSKTAEEWVIGSEEDAEETRDEEKDVIPNFELEYDNADGSEYEKTEDQVLQTADILNLTTSYACIIITDYLLT